MTREKLEIDWNKFQATENRFSDKKLYGVLEDDEDEPHHEWSYILHLAWAARKLQDINPIKHVDISSYIYFAVIVSAFIPLEFYEYRKFDIFLSHLTCGRADLVCLPFEDNSIQSLSCMHTIEHIGLGRYGDTLDPEGDIKAAKELTRVLAKDGDLLIVAPVGKSILRFNSHRTYSYQQVLDLFPDLELKEFSLILDRCNGGMINNASPYLVIEQPGDATGCFWFTK